MPSPSVLARLHGHIFLLCPINTLGISDCWAHYKQDIGKVLQSWLLLILTVFKTQSCKGYSVTFTINSYKFCNIGVNKLAWYYKESFCPQISSQEAFFSFWSFQRHLYGKPFMFRKIHSHPGFWKEQWIDPRHMWCSCFMYINFMQILLLLSQGAAAMPWRGRPLLARSWFS